MKQLLLIIMLPMLFTACAKIPKEVNPEPRKPVSKNKLILQHWAIQDLQGLINQGNHTKLSQRYSTVAKQSIIAKAFDRASKTLNRKFSPRKSPAYYTQSLKEAFWKNIKSDIQPDMQVEFVGIKEGQRLEVTYRDYSGVSPFIPIYLTFEIKVFHDSYIIRNYWYHSLPFDNNRALEEILHQTYLIAESKDIRRTSEDKNSTYIHIDSKTRVRLDFKTLVQGIEFDHESGQLICRACQESFGYNTVLTKRSKNKLKWLQAAYKPNYTEALALLPSVDPEIPGDSGITASRGFFLFKLNRHKEALASLNHAIKANPLSPYPYALATVISERLGDKKLEKQLRSKALLYFDDKEFNAIYQDINDSDK